ncbi:hypothetical protein [Yersinia intermedia]|nr:hypothetical protein [Yersinia intermedia]
MVTIDKVVLTPQLWPRSTPMNPMNPMNPMRKRLPSGTNRVGGH